MSQNESRMKADLVKISMGVANYIRNIYWQATRRVTVGVRGIAFQEDNILLIWHTYRGEWYLPGGGVKNGETLEQSIRREMIEEVGVTLGPISLLGIYTDFNERRTDHIVVFSGEILEYRPVSSIEIRKSQFFPLDALPNDISSGCSRRIQEFLQNGQTHFALW